MKSIKIHSQRREVALLLQTHADENSTYRPDEAKIDQESALDDCCIVFTDVSQDDMHTTLLASVSGMNMHRKFITLVIVSLLFIYIAYFVKALMLKRQGITVNLLGKGDKPKTARIVELFYVL